MNKLCIIVILLLVVISTTGVAVSAQTVDQWATQSECLAVLNDPTVPFYKPSLISKRNGPYKPSSVTVVRGLPANSCIDMDLPDRMGKRGWVKVEAGQEMVYAYNRDNTIGALLTMKACNNDIYGSATAKQEARYTPSSQDQKQDQTQSQSLIVNNTGPKHCPRSNVAGPNNSLLLQEQCEGEDPVVVSCIMGCSNQAQVQQQQQQKKGCGFWCWTGRIAPPVIAGGVGYAIGRRGRGGGRVLNAIGGVR